ncbi:unnamed protein product [Sphenostylis stenocarpa]|uniref:Uncharacterized protein n=1 Tax=Sphenostylis stenocarpa TaxID=92480 RepID=A0AA86SUD1_9FABA|nr:unnamed protein product [Sphenostylis stenocarpa]
MSVSQDFLSEAKRKLQELDQKDTDRKRTAELKNNLEGYTYTTMEKIETLEEFEKVSTSEEHRSFIEKLDDQVQDWFKELTARPAAVEHANKYIDELKQIVQEWRAKKSWLPEERVDEVIRNSEKLKNWLDEKEAEQKKTCVFSQPAFPSEEVYSKVFDLQNKVVSINRIPKPKPKPKVQKPIKNETESREQNTDSSSSHPSNSEGAGEETATEQPVVHDEL